MNSSPTFSARFQPRAKDCSDFVSFVLRYVGPNFGGRLVVIGCGTGEEISALARARPHAELIGIDISEDNIAVAKNENAKVRGTSPGILFLAADYLEANLGLNDFIVSNSTLQLIPAMEEQLFGKIARELKKNGRLIYVMPYDCLYNSLLKAVRLCLKTMRSRWTDQIILLAGKIIHGRSISTQLLRERISYAYLLPERQSGTHLISRLRSDFSLHCLEIAAWPVGSPAKPRHHAVVLEKVG